MHLILSDNHLNGRTKCLFISLKHLLYDKREADDTRWTVIHIGQKRTANALEKLEKRHTNKSLHVKTTN